MFVVWALLAACANATSSVLERRGAKEAPSADALSLRLVVDLVRKPVWLAGIAFLTAGFGLQALALHGAQLSAVEPILIIELPLTLLLAATAFRVRIRIRDLGAAVTMSAGLALLLLAGAPSGGDAGHVSGWAWGLTGLAVGGACAVLISVGWRAGEGDRRAAFWGIAAGAGFGLAAALIKATTAVLNNGLGAVFTSWKPYAMVAAGVGGLYIFQNAVQAGRLLFAQPAISLTDPLVSILIGVVLFGEHLRTGVFIVPELIGAAMIAGGTIALAHSPMIATDPDTGETAPRDTAPGGSAAGKARAEAEAPRPRSS